MGRVEEAQAVMRELEDLEREREKLSVTTNHPRVRQHRAKYSLS